MLLCGIDDNILITQLCYQGVYHDEEIIIIAPQGDEFFLGLEPNPKHN